jgi:hypothetical protein
MYGRNKFIFSPVEIEWLQLNKDLPLEQCAQALAKSRAAIKRQLDIFAGKEIPGKKNKSYYR